MQDFIDGKWVGCKGLEPVGKTAEALAKTPRTRREAGMSKGNEKSGPCGWTVCEECETEFEPTYYNSDLCPACDPPPNVCGICKTTEYGLAELETKKVCPECDTETRHLTPAQANADELIEAMKLITARCALGYEHVEEDNASMMSAIRLNDIDTIARAVLAKITTLDAALKSAKGEI